MTFRLHLRAPQLIGSSPAALFKGSEREDGRAVVDVAAAVATKCQQN